SVSVKTPNPASSGTPKWLESNYVEYKDNRMIQSRDRTEEGGGTLAGRCAGHRIDPPASHDRHARPSVRGVRAAAPRGRCRRLRARSAASAAAARARPGGRIDRW